MQNDFGLDPVSSYVAALLGAILGYASRDPLAWVCLPIVFAMGMMRKPWYAPVAMSAASAAITVAVVYSWWADRGVAHQLTSWAAWLFHVHLVAFLLIYGLGRGVRRLYDDYTATRAS